MAEIANPVRSPQEIAAAVSTFSLVQWARLERVGAKYAWKAGWSADDLLQEALARAVAGERKCPREVDVIRFLAEAMRGIADDEANKLINQAQRVPIMRGMGEDDNGVEPVDWGLTAEQAIISKEEAAAVLRGVMEVFADDKLARDMIDGIMLGYTAAEMCELLDVDATTYNSKRRKMRRALDRVFPNRRQP